VSPDQVDADSGGGKFCDDPVASTISSDGAAELHGQSQTSDRHCRIGGISPTGKSHVGGLDPLVGVGHAWGDQDQVK